MDNRPSQIRIYIFIPNRWCFWLGNIFLFFSQVNVCKYRFVKPKILRHVLQATADDGKQVEQSSDNRCVLWWTARVLVFELSFKWHTCSWCYFVRFWPISHKFNSCVTDRRTDWRTDRRTDRKTDTTSYKDAKLYLIKGWEPVELYVCVCVFVFLSVFLLNYLCVFLTFILIFSSLIGRNLFVVWPNFY